MKLTVFIFILIYYSFIFIRNIIQLKLKLKKREKIYQETAILLYQIFLIYHILFFTYFKININPEYWYEDILSFIVKKGSILLGSILLFKIIFLLFSEENKKIIKILFLWCFIFITTENFISAQKDYYFSSSELGVERFSRNIQIFDMLKDYVKSEQFQKVPSKYIIQDNQIWQYSTEEGTKKVNDEIIVFKNKDICLGVTKSEKFFPIYRR